MQPPSKQFDTQRLVARHALEAHRDLFAKLAVWVPSARRQDDALLAHLASRLWSSLENNVPEYEVTQVLVAAALVGTKSDKITHITGLPNAAIEMYVERCRAVGLFKGDQIHDSGWAQGVQLCQKKLWPPARAAALFFDIHLVLGNVKRRIKAGSEAPLF